jgi:hypothetical protein
MDDVYEDSNAQGSVADPDQEGSKTFGQIRTRSATDIKVLDTGLNPDLYLNLKPDPN